MILGSSALGGVELGGLLATLQAITGASSVTTEAVTSSGAGTVLVSGDSSTTTASTGSSGTGTVLVAGAGATTLGTTEASAGTVLVTGNSSSTTTTTGSATGTAGGLITGNGSATITTTGSSAGVVISIPILRVEIRAAFDEMAASVEDLNPELRDGLLELEGMM